MVHVNINRSDFELSKAFYEMLGFRVHWPVPKTKTHEVANALGMPNYEVHGALMALQNAERSKVIDALERKSPKDDSPPHPNLYRPWLASVAVEAQTLIKTMTFLSQRGWTCCPHPLMCTHRRLTTLGSSALKTPIARF